MVGSAIGMGGGGWRRLRWTRTLGVCSTGVGIQGPRWQGSQGVLHRLPNVELCWSESHSIGVERSSCTILEGRAATTSASDRLSRLMDGAMSDRDSNALMSCNVAVDALIECLEGKGVLHR